MQLHREHNSSALKLPLALSRASIHVFHHMARTQIISLNYLIKRDNYKRRLMLPALRSRRTAACVIPDSNLNMAIWPFRIALRVPRFVSSVRCHYLV